MEDVMPAERQASGTLASNPVIPTERSDEGSQTRRPIKALILVLNNRLALISTQKKTRMR